MFQGRPTKFLQCFVAGRPFKITKHYNYCNRETFIIPIVKIPQTPHAQFYHLGPDVYTHGITMPYILRSIN